MSVINQSLPPFKLAPSVKGRLRRKLLSPVLGMLEKSLSLDQLNEIHLQALSKTDDRHFTEKVLEVLNIGYEISERDLTRIPTKGPTVVVANHPFGAIEGILLGAVLRTARKDVKILANYILSRIPEMNDLLIYVDPFGGRDSARANLRGLRSAIEWVIGGGMLVVFPAGEVSHINVQQREITDPEWSETIARLVRVTESQALPVFFDGANGALFQLAGLVHPRLRTAMLPHELLNKRNQKIEIRVGNPIPFDRLKSFEDDSDMAAYLRQKTYALETRSRAEKAKPRWYFPSRQKAREFAPIVPPQPARLLLDDINNLPEDQRLTVSGQFEVFYAEAPQIPSVLAEIGRLREITFRQAGEGTGKPFDIDEFDEYYNHLFVWNRETSEIVGAYRLGETDAILTRLGKRGLYTSTLFDFQGGLLEKLSPALEMGRSFVRAEYQRSIALVLLWKGIGRYVARHPRYRILFGPVSIDNQYHCLSRQLMVEFLKANSYLPELARLARPRAPFRPKPIKGWNPVMMIPLLRDVDEASDLVSDIEDGQRGIPILLKQYLKLGGKLMGFNVDSSFGDVLDGLVLVDLLDTDRRVLERYLGKDGTAAFYAYHEQAEPKAS